MKCGENANVFELFGEKIYYKKIMNFNGTLVKNYKYVIIYL
jgi:hypothetical protein